MNTRLWHEFVDCAVIRYAAKSSRAVKSVVAAQHYAAKWQAPIVSPHKAVQHGLCPGARASRGGSELQHTAALVCASVAGRNVHHAIRSQSGPIVWITAVGAVRKSVNGSQGIRLPLGQGK